MTTLQRQGQHAPRLQRGTVLVVALIFLVLLTLIGLAGMQGSTLQERMAGNMWDRAIAFQRAEIALREGERWLNNGTNRDNALGHDRLDPPLAWDGTAWQPAVQPGLVPANARVYVEPPAEVRQDYSMDITEPACRRLFPVYAFATGGTDTAAVLLRSLFDSPFAESIVCPQP